MKNTVKNSRKLIGIILALFTLFITVNISPERVSAATGGQVVTEAKKYIGVPYKWGGTTTSGFDCSGYTQYVMNKCGVGIGRTTKDQIKNGTSVQKANLKAGDLVFFKDTYSGCTNPSHVGIYIGNNQFIHASSSKGVTISELNSNYYSQHYYGARRVLADSAPVINNSTEIENIIFDYQFYSDKYSDLKKAFGNDKAALLNHFKNNGISEGRCASMIFDVGYYLNHNQDLINAFGKGNYSAAYNHFKTIGYKEGRDLSPIFNLGYYIKNNPDVAKAYGNNYEGIINHFLNNGMKEGRQGSANFNLQAYKNNYEDLRKAFGNDNAAYYRHYMIYGINEGRVAK